MHRRGTFLIVSFVAACASRGPAAEPAPRPTPGNAVYDGIVALDPAAGTLRATWRIDFIADSTRADSLALYLNDGLRVSRVEGASVAGFVQDSAGDVVVRFAPALATGATARIELDAAGTPVFSADGINSLGAGWVELGLDSEWQPVIGGYDHEIVGRLRIDGIAGWDAVGSGAFTREGDALVLRNDVPLIDLGFSAAPVLASESAANATVYFVDADAAAVRAILDVADGCATWLDARYGSSDPLPHAKVVLAPRTGPGYARSNYIVITDVVGLQGAGLAHFLCHELAHFWSTGAVPFSPHYWMNEAFAEYVAGRYVRAVYGADAFAPILARWEEGNTGTPPIWTPQATSRPGPRVSYRKAPYLLHRFEERVGAALMDELLDAYMVGRLATTQELLDAVARVTGEAHAAWFREELGR